MRELIAKRKTLLDEAKAILDKAITETRALTDDESSAVDARQAEATQLQRTIERAQSFTTPTPSPASTFTPVVTSVHDNRGDAPFRNFGEFLLAVRNAGMPSNVATIDPRLYARAATGANTLVGAEGGFLVGTDIAPGVLQEMHEVAVLAPRCQQVTISSDANGIEMNGVDETSRAAGSRWGGVRGYWAEEAGTVTASKPGFRKIRLKLNKLMALFYATDETLADASALAGIAQTAFAEEMAFLLDDSILYGTGAGQPKGILMDSDLYVSITKETGQAAATIKYENLVKMYASMPARSIARAAWFINADVMPQLMLMTLDGGTASTPVFLPPGGATAAPYGTVFGRPVVPIEQAQALGTLGDIIFADFSQYLLATKGGLQQASSIHVQFIYGESVFRFTYRVDGQAMRKTKMTPYKGGTYLSPFVVLETRS